MPSVSVVVSHYFQLTEVFPTGPAMVLAVSLVEKVSIQEQEHVQTLPRLMVGKIAKGFTKNPMYVMRVVVQVRILKENVF